MIPTPFHGIFSSAFSAAGDTSTTKPLTKKTVVPAPEEAALKPTKARATGQVALDIFEYEDYYIIKAPIAGVRLQDLDIEIADNVLTIRGRRTQTDTIPDNQYYLKECFWGEFVRSVTLPCQIDPKRVKATFNKESILKILVPKEEKVKIIRIND
jgi:HSP20 family molecular chaperone IbpA